MIIIWIRVGGVGSIFLVGILDGLCYIFFSEYKWARKFFPKALCSLKFNLLYCTVSSALYCNSVCLHSML